ncbi:uncharacterized protein [Penaeus vannamei]|uniref:uncharacterized protein n=1 Tax=Penaeus vannamei TaxID=6689 RepID=UPI00387F7DBB
MKNLLAILPTAAMLYVVFMSQFPVNLYSRPKLLKPPEPAAVTVETPTLTESCYTYSNFTANNICCKMKKYSGSDILRCVKELSMEQILRHRLATGTTSNSSSPNDLGRVHVALVGDSHMRDMFVAMAERVAGENVLYKFESRNISWQTVGSLFYQMRARVERFETMRVQHLDFPLRVSWYRDEELKLFAGLIKKWESGEEPKPTFVITAFGLHWMKNHPTPTGVHYKEFFVTLAPHLARLAKTAPVYFKLVDFVIKAYYEKQRRHPGISVESIHTYNLIAREHLQGTGVTLWDSTLPLSVAYAHECLREQKTTPVLYTWKCHDDCHLGYLMLEQYADMVYNAVCNRFLGLIQTMRVMKSVVARTQPCLTPELTGKKLHRHFTALSVPVYRFAISPIILVGIPLSQDLTERFSMHRNERLLEVDGTGCMPTEKKSINKLSNFSTLTAKNQHIPLGFITHGYSVDKNINPLFLISELSSFISILTHSPFPKNEAEVLQILKELVKYQLS